MKRISLALWIASLAWFAVAAVAVAFCDIADRTGAIIGGISGLVALVGATAGCVGVCAD